MTAIHFMYLLVPHGNRFPGYVLDAEDHNLRGLYRRNVDDTDQASVVDIVLSHRGAITLDQERLLGGLALRGAVAPPREQEVDDGLSQPRTNRPVIAFELYAPGTFFNCLPNHNKQPPKVYVLPSENRLQTVAFQCKMDRQREQPPHPGVAVSNVR